MQWVAQLAEAADWHLTRLRCRGLELNLRRPGQPATAAETPPARVLSDDYQGTPGTTDDNP
jgi:hypothetical protein